MSSIKIHTALICIILAGATPSYATDVKPTKKKDTHVPLVFPTPGLNEGTQLYGTGKPAVAVYGTGHPYITLYGTGKPAVALYGACGEKPCHLIQEKTLKQKSDIKNLAPANIEQTRRLTPNELLRARRLLN